MKINSISDRQSFKALMIEKKPISKQQKLIIDNIKETALENKYAFCLLEHKYSDLYISPNSDGKTVDLKLLSAAGHTYNFIPKDENGDLKIKLHIPVNDPKKWNLSRIVRNIRTRTNKFIQRSINALYSDIDIPENTKMRNNLEYISMTDRDSKSLQLKENLPDAIVLYGNPQVTTRDFLRHN